MQYNKAEIVICGKKYTLQTQDDPDYIREIARQLDYRLREVLQANADISLTDAAVLVALDIFDEGLKANSDIDAIRMQIKSHVEEASVARAERDSALQTLAQANQLILKLQTDLELRTLKDEINQNETI